MSVPNLDTGRRSRTANSSTRYKMDMSRMANSQSLLTAGLIYEARKGGLGDSFCEFSVDVGRIDLRQPWIHKARLVFWSFWMIFAATGIDSLDERSASNDVIFFFYRVVHVCSLHPGFLSSDSASYTSLVAVMLLVLGVFMASVKMLRLYHVHRVPSTKGLHIFVGVNQLLLTFLSLAVGHTFGYFLRAVISSMSGSYAAKLVLSTITVVCLFLQMILWEYVYDATPLVRFSDPGQCWFCFVRWKLFWSLLPVIYAAGYEILKAFFSRTVSGAVFMVAGVAIAIVSVIVIVRSLPFLKPLVNVLYMTILGGSGLVAFLPLLHAVTSKLNSGLMELVVLVLLIPVLIIAREVIKRVIKGAVARFENCRSDPDLDIPTAERLLPYTFLPSSDNSADFSSFLECNYRQVSLYMRIGYLFDIPEVIDQGFPKWCFETGVNNGPLILAICQVEYLIGKDLNHIGIVEQACQSYTKASLNVTSFLVLLKALRQELLTQLNKPMMNALAQAKLANRCLLALHSEFWGFVLKQNIDGMKSLIPRIAEEGYETEFLYQRLKRWYPATPIILRELSSFCHKSLGQHSKTLWYHAMYNRTKRGDLASVNSGSSSTCESLSSYKDDDVEGKFQTKMDPWITCEDTLDHVPNKQVRCLIAFVVISCCIVILVPVSSYIMMMIQCKSFTKNFHPVATISSLEYYVVRIPLLLRYAQLHSQGVLQINDFRESVGVPGDTELEVETMQSALEAATAGVSAASKVIVDVLANCQTISTIYEKCLVQPVPYINGDTTEDLTIYSAIDRFIYEASELIRKRNMIDWSNVDKEPEMIRIFQNFNTVFQSLQSLSSSLATSLESLSNTIATPTKYYYIWAWVMPAIVVIPFLIYVTLRQEREATFLLRLLFQIPKSEVSALHWSSRGKPNQRRMQDDRRTAMANQSSAFPSIEMGGEPLTTRTTQSSWKSDDALEGLSTVEYKPGGIRLILSAAALIFMFVSCGVASVGIFLYNNSMQRTIPRGKAYEKSISSHATSVASELFVQEIFANTETYFTTQEARKHAQFYSSLFQRTLNSMLFGSSDENLLPAYFDGGLTNTIYAIDNSSNTIGSAPILGIIHDAYIGLTWEVLVRLLDETERIISKDNAAAYPFSTVLPYHYQHMKMTHLMGILSNVSDEMHRRANHYAESTTVVLNAVFIPLLIVQVVYIVLVYYPALENTLRQALMPKTFMKLITPAVLLKCQPVLRWISGSFDSGKKGTTHHDATKVMNTEFIIAHSKSGLVLTNQEMIIERANNFAAGLFGYETDNFIGLNFFNVLLKKILNEDKHKLLDTIKRSVEKFVTGKSKSGRKEFTIMVKGQNNQISYLRLLIRGHSKQEDDDNYMIHLFRPPATSLSIVLYDRTAEHYQEELVDHEKKRGEQLLLSFMPLQIARRITDGETDIFFEVQSVTALVTSIANFNTTIADMNASQAIHILDKVYAAYDEELTAFPAITKLKTNGPVYVIVAGLFSDSTVNHGEVALKYALRLLERIHDINEECGWNLSVTIGVSSGGPVSCGLIGKVRPVFAVLGDVVSDAMNCNATGVEAYIQITESTYELVKYLSYPIREKDPNGKIRTYLISPKTQSSALRNPSIASDDSGTNVKKGSGGPPGLTPLPRIDESEFEVPIEDAGETLLPLG